MVGRTSDATAGGRPATGAVHPGGGRTAALVRRTFGDARTRTVVFAYIFAIYSWLEVAGFKRTYPTLADRVAFARSFAGNAAIRLFYGYPYDVTTVGGYSAWRVGGTLAVAAAAFGVLASVRALRAEEDAGRTDILMAGAVSRGALIGSAMAAIGTAVAILFVAEFAGLAFGGLPVAGSAYLALATASIIPVFAGIAAMACQLAPNRRMALALAGGTTALLWLVRVLSDTVSGGAWLRWTTPLGWAEELRPFAGARPAVLLLFPAAAMPLLIGAARISATRDVGSGLLGASDSSEPSSRLLGSASAFTLRLESATLATWGVAIATLATVFGMISTSVSTAGISTSMQKDLARLGAGAITTPTGYLSFVFIVFIYAVCLFVCAQVGAGRQEEGEARLETLLALPVSRYRWLGGRLLVAACAAGVLSVLTGLGTWAGAESEGLHVSPARLLEAGANCFPLAVLFLGLSSLAYAAAPRASAAVSYTLVTTCFVWYLVGSVLGLPRWLIDVTPFQHIGLVPAQPFRVLDALVMATIGVGTAAAALAVFRRRDLLGA